MAYNNITNRDDAGALIPEEVSNVMLGKATEQSAVLNLFGKVPVQTDQVRFKILSALPVAYWVDGDTGLIQTTEVNWANKYMNIEEMAVIVPFPNNVVADMENDMWGQAEPLVAEAFARTLDSTVFFGVNAPSSFPTNVASAALAAGGTNIITEGSTAAQGGFFGDVDKLYGGVEDDGFEVNGFVAATGAKAKFRTARDSNGRKLDDGRLSGDLRTLDGYPIQYAMKGLWPSGTFNTNKSIRLLAGDWDQFKVGIRQDISIKILTESVIQDNTGAIVYNLAQQNMTAVRLTFRAGWQVANTINNENPTEATRYPVSVLQY